MKWSRGRRLDPALIVVGAAMMVCALVALGWWIRELPLGVDSAVYRAGGFAVVRKESLYSPLRALPGWAPELPFTYPPFAALLFSSLTALPTQLCWGLLALAAAPSLYFALRPFADRAHLPLLLLGAFALQPVWQTIGLGQVNLVLMAAVVTDLLLLRDSRRCGIMIGIVAAVKLVPLIFIVHLLVARRTADAARALAAFLGATVFAMVVLPADSVRFWTSAIFNDHFAEMKGWVGNQSWQGFVARTVPEGRTATVVIVVSGVVFAVLSMWFVHRLHRAGDDRAAVLVTAGCSLLISPISWTHHWVWVVPAIGFFAAGGHREVALAVAVVFTGWTVAVVPGGGGAERDWNLVQALIGNAYLLTLLIVGFFRLPWRITLYMLGQFVSTSSRSKRQNAGDDADAGRGRQNPVHGDHAPGNHGKPTATKAPNSGVGQRVVEDDWDEDPDRVQRGGRW
ncbi:glycosyltransferase 87 family protein [Amycolatopsis sp. QT-25]|uniref:glycosyltransferase 87 family protein n=1 Tax=Amycolatopsis sp. QT-25 TaxID=3034022 RepID=UPI0023ED2C8A|nr:glycosyltransferase 87 family protein [Amycolatopsis sp. QT-25]WET83010.1 glycosyltransferase 87 family protein [Amycolatopsis sp. QT-25]